MAGSGGHRGSPGLRQKDKGSLARENSLLPPASRIRRVFGDEDEREGSGGGIRRSRRDAREGKGKREGGGGPLGRMGRGEVKE